MSSGGVVETSRKAGRDSSSGCCKAPRTNEGGKANGSNLAKVKVELRPERAEVMSVVQYMQAQIRRGWTICICNKLQRSDRP